MKNFDFESLTLWIGLTWISISFASNPSNSASKVSININVRISNIPSTDYDVQFLRQDFPKFLWLPNGIIKDMIKKSHSFKNIQYTTTKSVTNSKFLCRIQMKNKKTLPTNFPDFYPSTLEFLLSSADFQKKKNKKYELNISIENAFFNAIISINSRKLFKKWSVGEDDLALYLNMKANGQMLKSDEYKIYLVHSPENSKHFSKDFHLNLASNTTDPNSPNTQQHQQELLKERRQKNYDEYALRLAGDKPDMFHFKVILLYKTFGNLNPKNVFTFDIPIERFMPESLICFADVDVWASQITFQHLANPKTSDSLKWIERTKIPEDSTL